MSHGRQWRVDHSIMINVTWQHFDQSAKQLIAAPSCHIFNLGFIIFQCPLTTVPDLYNVTIYMSAKCITHVSLRTLLLTLPAQYVEQVLWNSRASVRSSVCPIDRPLQRRAACLLLSAERTGAIDRLQTRRAAGTGAQQQRRRSTALSSKCRQCNVDCSRRKLNWTQTCVIIFQHSFAIKTNDSWSLARWSRDLVMWYIRSLLPSVYANV